jgi:hypothetical protein
MPREKKEWVVRSRNEISKLWSVPRASVWMLRICSPRYLSPGFSQHTYALLQLYFLNTNIITSLFIKQISTSGLLRVLLTIHEIWGCCGSYYEDYCLLGLEAYVFFCYNLLISGQVSCTFHPVSWHIYDITGEHKWNRRFCNIFNYFNLKNKQKCFYNQLPD